MSLFFRRAFGVSFLGLRQHRWNDAFRPNYEGGSLGRGKPEFGRVKTVDFEIVPHRLRTGGSKVAFLTHISLTSTLVQLGEFLISVELFRAEALRPFKRRQCIIGPDSLKVRLTVGCARRRPSPSC